MNNNIKKIIKTFLIAIIIICLCLIINIIVKLSYSKQDLYDILPENVILIGDKYFEGYVNPNFIANSSIEYYKKTNDKDIKVFKYSGLDKNENPIWGKYSDEYNSYIEANNEEIKQVEDILRDKLKLN